ncbi:Lpg0189 family type II secretion system effector [Legionella sp.]|uniref:Lpg0189 family type II secretion system effector n=1 Tax=Legionella sp. TaxID=459 RepID=UPI003C9BF012
MKFNYLVTFLILLPFYAFSNSHDNFKFMTLSSHNENKNTQSTIFTNESTNFKHSTSFTRTIDFPTQIIRMDSNVENQQITCKTVHDQINKILVENIANNHFIYAIYISCHYNPETYLATQFTINSYFDPANDEGVTYLKSYLGEYNGSNFLGTKLKIESAKGLIISLSMAAGMKKNPTKPPFIEYRRDRSNLYFKNNYEMKNKLFTDIYQNFYSNEPDLVLSFLNKWIFSHADSLYKAILRDSNYAELQPERIFLMENDGELFVSVLKQYFMHYCEQYDNHRCLKKPI